MLRRRYIALASTLLFILIMILYHFTSSNKNDPNDFLKQYYQYPLLVFQIILMRVVYVSKNEDTKNIITGMNVIITLLYLVLFLYQLLIA